MERRRDDVRLLSFGSFYPALFASFQLGSIREDAICPRADLVSALCKKKLASGYSGFLLSTVFLSFCIVACGQTVVRPLNRLPQNDLPRPSRIAIGQFSVGNAAIMEYQGIFRQQPLNRNRIERQRLMANDVAEALSLELATKLKELGFLVERGPLGIPAGNDITIEGEFIRIDEGNPLRRFVVGLGSGASRVQTRLVVYQGSQRIKLLEFTTDADSGKMPGAAITFAAGATAPPLVSAGLVTANGLATGLQNRSEVAYLARSSANQAAQYLSEYFARQGWIRPDQMKKARIAH
jgi:hypothetical protein